MKKTLYFFLLVFICGWNGFAGETGTDLVSMRNAYIRTNAMEADGSKKLEALHMVSLMIENGSINPQDEELMAILSLLGTEVYLKPQRTGISPILQNDFIEIRKQTAVLLGTIGGDLAHKVLLDMLHFEQNIDVVKNILYAIGDIGLNPDLSTSRSIGNRVIHFDSTMMMDNGLAYAAAVALEKIAQKNQGIADPGVFDTLIRLNSGRYNKVVQNKVNGIIRFLLEVSPEN